jgi:hypothetical protein
VREKKRESPKSVGIRERERERERRGEEKGDSPF